MMIMPMLSMFLIIIPLAYILYKEQKKKQIKEDGKKKYHFDKMNLIRFDKCQLRQCTTCTIMFLVLLIVSVVFVHLELLDGVSDAVMVIIMLVYVCSGPALLYSVYQLLSGISYVRRLKKHGYQVPENKKDYDFLLEVLPRAQQTDNSMLTEKKYNKVSCALGICSLLAFMVLCGFNIWFILEWHFLYAGEVVFMVGIMSVVDIVLLVYCMQFFLQMNEQRYKDDVEIDTTRKNRMPLMEGVITVIILLGISVSLKYMAYSTTDYIFESRVSADIATAQSIQQSLIYAYEVMKTDEVDTDWKTTKNELMNGVDITMWGIPGDAFQEEIAQVLGISDFAELQDDFHTAVGNAVVYVKLEDEKFVVELGNPAGKVLEHDGSVRAE